MDCCESICATIHLGHFLLMLLLPPRISERVFKDSSEVLCATGSGCRLALASRPTTRASPVAMPCLATAVCVVLRFHA